MSCGGKEAEQAVDNLKDLLTGAGGQGTGHEVNRRFWLSYEGLSSESFFRRKLFSVVLEISTAYNADDLERMERALERIIWVEPLVQSEPYLSIYETGLVLATIPIALTAASRFDFDRGYRIAQYCREVLIGKRNRREEMGLSYRADSECWYRLYNLLAELKWKGPADMRDRITSPENLICDYLKIERRCMQYMETSPSDNPDRDQNVLEALGWCGLQIIKMSARWCPQHVNVLIDGFNRTHGSVLTPEIGHFLEFRPLDAQNPWYWDFELYKWCVQGPGTPEEATLCNQWRLDATRNFAPKTDISRFLEGCERELAFFLGARGPGGTPREVQA
jgi:hypothetical protein